MIDSNKNVIAEPIGSICQNCTCQSWCKAEWRIKRGNLEYTDCAERISDYANESHPSWEGGRSKTQRSADLWTMLWDLATQQPDRWAFNNNQRLVPRGDYWRRGEGKDKLPSC